jgi:hypothetical protein
LVHDRWRASDKISFAWDIPENPSIWTRKGSQPRQARGQVPRKGG